MKNLRSLNDLTHLNHHKEIHYFSGKLPHNNHLPENMHNHQNYNELGEEGICLMKERLET